MIVTNGTQLRNTRSKREFEDLGLNDWDFSSDPFLDINIIMYWLLYTKKYFEKQYIADQSSRLFHLQFDCKGKLLCRSKVMAE